MELGLYDGVESSTVGVVIIDRNKRREEAVSTTRSGGPAAS